MDGVARRALGDVFGRDDVRLDAARRDLRGETLGGGGGRVEADELAARRAQRRGDA